MNRIASRILFVIIFGLATILGGSTAWAAVKKSPGISNSGLPGISTYSGQSLTTLPGANSNSPECDISGFVSGDRACASANGAYAFSGSTKPSPFVAARSSPGSNNIALDVWGKCRYVDNISTDTSIFVPFNTSSEWLAFVNNASTGVIRDLTTPSTHPSTHCARAFTGQDTPQNLFYGNPNRDFLPAIGDTSSDGQSVTGDVSLPYERSDYGTINFNPYTFSDQCYDEGPITQYWHY